MAVTDTIIQRVKAQLSWPALAFLFVCDCLVHGPDRADSEEGREQKGKGCTGNLKLHFFPSSVQGCWEPPKHQEDRG